MTEIFESFAQVTFSTGKKSGMLSLPGGEGYPLTVAMQVCAAQQSHVFGTPINSGVQCSSHFL